MSWKFKQIPYNLDIWSKQTVRRNTLDDSFEVVEIYSKWETDTLLNNKVDKEAWKGLSTNDYTTTEKNKLSWIEPWAEVNTVSPWDIPTLTSDLTNDNLLSDITAGANITIDKTDPRNPVITASWWGGGWTWDVVWPASSTNGAIAVFDWTTWKLIKNSLANINSAWQVNFSNTVACNNGWVNSLYSSWWIAFSWTTNRWFFDWVIWNELIKFPTKIPLAVNEFTISNAATWDWPKLEATWWDTNIDLLLVSKWTGKVKVNGNEVSWTNTWDQDLSWLALKSTTVTINWDTQDLDWDLNFTVSSWITDHNNLTNIQWWTVWDYQHLTTAQVTALWNAVPNTRTITINWTTQDLSTDRTWTLDIWLVWTKVVNEWNIWDWKILSYNNTSWQLEYITNSWGWLTWGSSISWSSWVWLTLNVSNWATWWISTIVWNSSTAPFFWWNHTIIWNTQTAAHTANFIDLWTAAVWHRWIYIWMPNASTSARWIDINPSTTWTWSWIYISNAWWSWFVWYNFSSIWTSKSWILLWWTWTWISFSAIAFWISFGIQSFSGATWISLTSSGGDYNFIDIATLTTASSSTAIWFLIRNLNSNTSNVISKFFSLNWTISWYIASRTTNMSEILVSRTNTTTAWTKTDNYSIFNISRTNIQNGTWWTFISTWAVLSLNNTATQTAGTLTDTVAVLKLTQSSTTSNWWHILFNTYTPWVEWNIPNWTLWYNWTNIKYKDSMWTVKTITVT